MAPAQPELDRGSYLSAYGLLNPWTLWLLAHEPELVSLRPSELHQASVAPRCPDPLCKRPMQMRAYSWRCYYHEPPRSLAPGIQTPKVKWVPGQPDVLALVGRDGVDVVWQDSQGGQRPEGYVITFRRRPDVPRTKDLAKAVSGRGRRHQNVRRAGQ